MTMIRYVDGSERSEVNVRGMAFRGWLIKALTLGSVMLMGSAAVAQGPPIPPSSYAPTPTFSPWLNLLRRDNPTALNYYGLVRPQQEFRFGIQSLQQQALTTQQALRATEGFTG